MKCPVCDNGELEEFEIIEKDCKFGDIMLHNVKVKYSVCSNCKEELIMPDQIDYNGYQIKLALSDRQSIQI